AEDGIRDRNVTGVQTCALPIFAQQLGQAQDEEIVENAAAAGGVLKQAAAAGEEQVAPPHTPQDVPQGHAPGGVHPVLLAGLGRVLGEDGDVDVLQLLPQVVDDRAEDGLVPDVIEAVVSRYQYFIHVSLFRLNEIFPHPQPAPQAQLEDADEHRP